MKERQQRQRDAERVAADYKVGQAGNGPEQWPDHPGEPKHPGAQPGGQVSERDSFEPFQVEVEELSPFAGGTEAGADGEKGQKQDSEILPFSPDAKHNQGSQSVKAHESAGETGGHHFSERMSFEMASMSARRGRKQTEQPVGPPCVIHGDG